MSPRISKKIVSPTVTPAALGRNIIIEKLNILIQPLRDRHARHYRDNHFHLWADLILAGALIGSASILIWLIFWQPKADFLLESKFTNARVVSGQTQEFVLRYENQEEAPIQSASIVMALPQHATIVSSNAGSTFDISSNSFMLGDLPRGAHGEITFGILMKAPIGERQTIGFALTYQKGQIKKQLLSSLMCHIDASALELSLDIPEKAYRDIPFNGAVELKNSGDSKLEKVAVAFSPEDWEITPDGNALEEGRIVIPILEPGETKRLSFSALTKETAPNKGFGITSAFVIEQNIIAQNNVEKKIAVIEPSLIITSKFREDSFSESPVELKLNLKNSDNAEISNISLAVESQRDTVTVAGVTSQSPDTNSSNNAILLNTALPANAEKSITLSVDLRRHGTVFNDYVSLGVKVSYQMNGENYSYVVAVPKLKIDSNLSLSSAGYYYGPQGDQLGIGPIPPQVDIPTTYWIIWEANNLGNDVANFEVSADLPANVVWLDQKSLVAGEMSYSPVGRRVLWKVDKLAQSGGNYRASFAISIVPRAEDLGTVPTILSNILFKGDDQYSLAQISKKSANITTNIEKDRQAGGKGKVEALK